MPPYAAPLAEMRFILNNVVGLPQLGTLPGGAAATPDVVDAVLEEAARLAGNVLAPLNVIGDRTGSVLENGVVRTPPGFAATYRAFVDGGWNGLASDPAHGGQGLPFTLGMAVQEMWQSANLSFGLCPLLTQGAVELLTAKGSPEQQRLYLPRLVSGDWTGTMNLTEPQAGSDVGAVRTKAVREGDHYRITGQKIYITYGDHDFTDNIIHMVLARTPDAPPGIKGISLFVVPKFLVNADGSLGQRNDVRAVSLEHKLGIHASPTAVMAFGDGQGAIGSLVGEENRGIEYMFIMMNNARLGVGLQGVAIAERAYQQAVDYARTRVQSRDFSADKNPAAIIRHPDVRRMLMSMRCQTEAARALAYEAAIALDTAKHHPDAALAAAAQGRVDLLTPIVKAWGSEVGVEVASEGIQVHGGMGFIEDTGAAQHYRDARITPIYEGTNGIQANDLVFRKVARDGGAQARRLLAEMAGAARLLADQPGDDAAVIAAALTAALPSLAQATDWLTATAPRDPAAAAAGAMPYLRLFAIVAGGFMQARAAAAALTALSAPGHDAGFLEARLISARFYAEMMLPQAPGLLAQTINAHKTVMALTESQF